jgi:integrase
VVLGSVADLPTRKDAQVRLDEELRGINQGTVRPESSMLFGTFAEEQWKTLVLPTLKLSTQHGYKTVLAKHLLPYWRDWRLRDIGRQDVQQWVADRFRRQLGWQTVRNAWTLLSGILETAVEYGYLSTNPARGVKFPEKELKEAPVLFTAEDFTKLLEQLDEPYRTMARLIALTGLRIGELLAVRWRCLDLEIGTLSVRESVYEGKFQSPKTRKSRRTIPLGPQSILWLREHRLRATRIAADDLLFGNRSGKPLRESKLLRNVLQPAAERAGLGRVTAPVPPHPLVAPERPARAGQDRAGAARAFQHFDDAEHLHARRRCLAPQGDRSARTRIVPKCSQIAGWAEASRFSKS